MIFSLADFLGYKTELHIVVILIAKVSRQIRRCNPCINNVIERFLFFSLRSQWSSARLWLIKFKVRFFIVCTDQIFVGRPDYKTEINKLINKTNKQNMKQNELGWLILENYQVLTYFISDVINYFAVITEGII